MADTTTTNEAITETASELEPQIEHIPTRVLEHVNVAPAQTWNRLRANDVTLSVPNRSRKGDVYFALPRLFSGVECGMGTEVTSWIVSQAADARYVEVPARSIREEPVVIALSAAQNEVADTGIMVREGAEVTIVVAAGTGEADSTSKTAAVTTCDAPATSASLLRIIAEAGAHITLIEVIGIGEDQQHLESVGIRAGEGARVEVHQYALGGGTVAIGFAAELVGARARIDLSLRYLARDTETLDVNHVVRQKGRNTRAEISEYGILADEAKKSLRATIDLVHGAKGAAGNEAETVLVLGDKVINKTTPVILCDEDDVQGNHGATIGSVSPEQLQYLCDRGLSKAEAEQLFVRAILEDAIMHAPDDASHAVAVARAEAVLGNDLAHDFDDSAKEDLL